MDIPTTAVNPHRLHVLLFVTGGVAATITMATIQRLAGWWVAGAVGVVVAVVWGMRTRPMANAIVRRVTVAEQRELLAVAQVMLSQPEGAYCARHLSQRASVPVVLTCAALERMKREGWIVEHAKTADRHTSYELSATGALELAELVAEHQASS